MGLLKSAAVCRGLVRFPGVCKGLLRLSVVCRGYKRPVEVYWCLLRFCRGLQGSAGAC